MDIRFRVPFDNLKPITRFVAYTLDKDGANYLSHAKNDLQEGDIFFKMTLKGEGVMNFTVKAENEIGLAQ